MKISIIIPALNEAKSIQQTLVCVAKQLQNDQLIVVDGGSSDQTVALAKPYASVIAAPRGRAAQMNAGARAASGDVLLFLHADTLLPANGLALIRAAFENAACEAGRFRMQFDDKNWLLEFYQLHTRFHFFSYGDQAFFVKRPLFEQLKGFREDVPFEDIDFYKRLRMVAKPCIIRASVVTSARRFRAMGSTGQKLINLWLVTLYYLGFNVLPLKQKLYPDIR
ncbi:MAG: glycosyl transferase [Candidatus Omnitrophica bacterium CG11_big_fil_rev_8_21_14_0_20_45_26]|uniref:Glycosyl transferase n=1 Tax=Candidatus Abzuiibacterium crystallinum TaxID=1974748 RepID=A0A2H0LNX4_9BACT|nr:MAG: glycosyl transferase [Candidatus Omnitrophica bacterium CG11_big_fil_rev_8_21_14_0_20_45_26]PIW65661.1 MAG: glycosyl transferase [Candidatus Omnitrophica bacterium CG12_big_fil_rev_8_21_14_0_65_45_16]